MPGQLTCKGEMEVSEEQVEKKIPKSQRRSIQHKKKHTFKVLKEKLTGNNFSLK
jgi:hypothetical protein